MKINELELPPSLEADLRGMRTRLSPNELNSFKALLIRVEAPLPELLDLEALLQENCLWTTPEARFYLGTPSQMHWPGDTDLQKTLIFGQAEPDSPVALDYRTEPPRVVYLGNIENKTYWFELAPTYEAFIAKIRSPSSDV